jgi:hypothetical protein
MPRELTFQEERYIFRMKNVSVAYFTNEEDHNSDDEKENSSHGRRGHLHRYNFEMVVEDQKMI